MSADNYNLIIQLPNGKWFMSPNHSFSELMSWEEYAAYQLAISKTRPEDQTITYDTEADAFVAADAEETEYGTFSHRYQDWFETIED